MVLFLETSALVKLYVRERGTDAMLGLLGDEPASPVVVLAVSRVEFASALWRRARDGDLTGGRASDLEARLRGHMATRFTVQPLTDELLEMALVLLRRHPLRAYDAIQLAGAIVSRSSSTPAGGQATFACSDRTLLEAAAEEGLSVFDPTAVAGA